MSKYEPLIWDCFTVWGFGSEMDLLEARIEYLYPFVHRFVLVESKTQHDGTLKDFVLEENKERFSKYWDKIIYIKDIEDVSVGSTGWNVENHHRNCVLQGLKDAHSEDIIIISDLDEFWHPKHVPFLKSDRFKQGDAYGFLCDFYNYFFNCISSLNPCVGSVCVKKETLDKVNPQHMRNIKDKIPRLIGGIHASYLGGIDHIWKKFMTSCDVTDKSEIPSKEELKNILIKRLKEGQFNLRHDIDLPLFFIENPDIPHNITKEKYPQFFIESLEKI